MNATRMKRGSTSDTVSVLIDHMQDGVSDVRLFATHPNDSGKGYDDLSGPSANLPLVAALVYDGRRWIVFDGNLLNGQREPRAAEVRTVIDAAIADGKVVFGGDHVDFTAGMTPSDAASYLEAVPTEYLSERTKGDYAALLRMA